jgi:DivIVA domain-containing protein
MDSTESPYSALDAIDTVAFKIGVRGYNVDEVDDFLEKLSGEVHQLKELVSQQRQQLRQAGERINQLDARGASDAPLAAPAPAPAPAPRHVSVSGAEQVTAMIVMAQQFIEQAQSEAEAKAREMTSGAQERAREIVAEARSRAEDEVNRLNGLKQRLSEDVETLTRQLDAERKRLGSALAEFSRWIESSLQVGGARGAVASAPEPAPRPMKPPPAPAPSHDTGVGQVLNFEAPSHDDRL